MEFTYLEVTFFAVNRLLEEIKDMLDDLDYYWFNEEKDEELENRILKPCTDLKLREEEYLRLTDSLKESTYDGFDFKDLSIMGIFQENIPEAMNRIGTLKGLDKNERKKKGKGPINLRNLIGYLAGIKEIREIVYNNEHGIVVRDPERNNYPEKMVMDTLKDIILEGISGQECYEQKIIGMLLESSPEDSIAGKLNKLIPTIKFAESDDMLDIAHDSKWNHIDDVNKVIIPADCVDLLRPIYAKKAEYTITDKHGTETFAALNDLALDTVFQVK